MSLEELGITDYEERSLNIDGDIINFPSLLYIQRGR